MEKCPNCNAELSANALTCAACGVALQPKNLTKAEAFPLPSIHHVPQRRKWLSVPVIAVLLVVTGIGSVVYAGVEQAREAARSASARC